MSREAWGDPPEQEPQRCPVCDGEWHAEGCEFGQEVSRRLEAEAERNRLRAALDTELATNRRALDHDRELRDALTAERDRLRALTVCGCGDQFSAHDPGTCGACLAGATCGKEIDKQTIERLTADRDRLLDALIALLPYSRPHHPNSQPHFDSVVAKARAAIDAAAKGQATSLDG